MNAPNVAWSTASIRDEYFRARFVNIPAIVTDWIGEPALRAARILDFGCGEGVAALAFALRFPGASVTGIDIMPDPERCPDLAREQLGLRALPSNLRLHRVAPGSMHREDARFDVAYSWSVFEHVDQSLLDRSLGLIRSSLAPDGRFLVQIAPLYYSAEGSHLFHKLPVPWMHLFTQHSILDDQLRRAVPDEAERQALMSTYATLNRITAPELMARIEKAGFRILRSYTTSDDRDPPPELTAIYQPNVLRTNQVVVLASP